MSLREEVFDGVRIELAELSLVPPERIVESADLFGDLGLDSLSLLTLLARLHSRFKIELYSVDLFRKPAVGSIVDLIMDKIDVKEAV